MGPKSSFRVLLGISGGIAAYKACTVLRLLTESGHDVRVVPTEAALRFVGAPTWAALSGHPVTTGVWDDVHEVPHVRLGQEADLVAVAPATADLMARAAHGLADDLLTSTLLTARCPILLAPAMHTEMWEHPATRANVAVLRERGVTVLEPAYGRLTGDDTGQGRLPEPEVIVAECARLLGNRADVPTQTDLTGRRVVVSAGGTREPLDPVRFIGNRSSGLQGWALAAAAADRGAQVTLVAANVDLEPPDGVTLVAAGTALELREAVLARAGDADVVVMAAAVADFRPAHYSQHKIKKSGGRDDEGRDDAMGDDDAPRVDLVRNPDILAELSSRRAHPGQVVVGFAAETGDTGADVLTHARRKLARKGCDLLVVNDVSAGRAFGAVTNAVTILDRDGGSSTVEDSPKRVVAHAVWNAVVARLQ